MATDSYEYTTFLPLGEIFDFNGEDVEGWLSQIEDFFDRYQLDPLQRLAVIHNFMVGEATEWHYEMYLNWRLTTWESFVIDLRNRFSLSNMVNEDAIEVYVPEDSDDDAQILLVESAIEDMETAAVVVVDKQNDDDIISDLYHDLVVDESVVVGVTTREVTSNMFALNRCFLVLKDAAIREWSFKTQFHAINGALPPCLLTVCENVSVNLSTMSDAMLVKPPAKPPDSLKIASKLVIMNCMIDKSLIYERILVIARVPKEWDKSFQDVKKMRNRGVFYGKHFCKVMIDSYGKCKYLDHALTAVNIMRSKEESNFLPKLMLFGDLSFYVSIFDLADLSKYDGNVKMIQSIYDPLIRNKGLALVIMSNGKKVAVATEFLGQDGCEMQGEHLTLDKPPPLPSDIILTHPLWRCGKVNEWTDMTICWDVKGFDEGCFKGNLARVLYYKWVVEDGAATRDYGIRRCANGQCTQVSFVSTPYKHVILHDLCGVLVKDRPESMLFRLVRSKRDITNWILRLPEVLFIDFSSPFVLQIFDVARGIAELGFGTRVVRFSKGKGPGLDAFIVFIGSAFDMYYDNHLKLLRLGMSFDMLVMLPAKLPYSWQVAFGYHVHSVILSVVMCLKLSNSSSDFCTLTDGSNEASLLIMFGQQ